MATCSRLATIIAAVALSGAPYVRAGEIPIDISGLANEPWTYVGPNDFLIINGSTFPTGTQNFGGIPFSIPAGPNNYWAGAAAANFGPGTGQAYHSRRRVRCHFSFHCTQLYVGVRRSASLS